MSLRELVADDGYGADSDDESRCCTEHGVRSARQVKAPMFAATWRPKFVRDGLRAEADQRLYHTNTLGRVQVLPWFR